MSASPESGKKRTCVHCGVEVHPLAKVCLVCERLLDAKPRSRERARRRRVLLSWGTLLSTAAILGIYLYPNIRFREDVIVPRERSGGVSLVGLSEPPDLSGWACPGGEWNERVLWGVRFQLPRGEPLRFAGDEEGGLLSLEGWTLGYALRRSRTLPDLEEFRVEGEAALGELQAAARDDIDFLRDVYAARPEDYHLFYTPGARGRLSLRLALKEALALDGALWGISLLGPKDEPIGFVFGDPGESPTLSAQVLVPEGRLELVARANKLGRMGAQGLAWWLASIAPYKGGDPSRDARATLATELDRLRASGRTGLPRAAFVALGLATSGGDSAGREAWSELSRDLEELVRMESCLEEALARAAGALHSEVREIYLEETTKLPGTGADLVTGVLERAMAGYRPELALPAAQALSRWKDDPAALEGLLRALSCDDSQVARWALFGLAERNEDRVLTAFATLLETRPSWMGEELLPLVIEAGSRIAGPAALSWLGGAVGREPTPVEFGSLAEGMSRASPPVSREVWSSLLSRGTDESRFAILGALERRVVPAAIPPLCRLVEEASQAVRVRAHSLLVVWARRVDPGGALPEPDGRAWEGWWEDRALGELEEPEGGSDPKGENG